MRERNSEQGEASNMFKWDGYRYSEYVYCVERGLWISKVKDEKIYLEKYSHAAEGSHPYSPSWVVLNVGLVFTWHSKSYGKFATCLEAFKYWSRRGKTLTYFLRRCFTWGTTQLTLCAVISNLRCEHSRLSFVYLNCIIPKSFRITCRWNCPKHSHLSVVSFVGRFRYPNTFKENTKEGSHTPKSRRNIEWRQRVEYLPAMPNTQVLPGL